MSLVDHDLPADHFVVRGRISAECDAADEELSILVHIDREMNQLVLLVEIMDRDRRKVDVAAGAIEFFEILKSLAQQRLVVIKRLDVPAARPVDRADFPVWFAG